MANVDRPNGFRFAKSLTGHSVNALARKYPAAAGVRNATTGTDPSDPTGTVAFGDIYLGDAITLNTSGDVQVALTSNPILGVVVGVGTDDGIQMGEAGAFNADALQDRFLAPDEAGFIWYIPAEDNLFEVQAATTLADDDLGANADIIPAAAAVHGSRLTSRSIQEIGDPTNDDVSIVEINQGVENDLASTNARFIVKFNTTINSQTAGAPVAPA